MTAPKYVTKRGIALMISHAIKKSNNHLPTGTLGDLDGLGNGKAILVFVKQYTISPGTPGQDELREYRRVDGKLFFKAWKGA